MPSLRTHCILHFTLTVILLLSINIPEAISTENAEPGYNERCSENRLCPYYLNCTFVDSTVGAKCLCPHPDHQEYDAEVKNCRSLLDSPCNLNDNNGCPPLAECVKKGEKFPPTCQCQNGTESAADGTCQISYGVSCSKYEPGPHENSEPSDSCDKEDGFVCKIDSEGKFRCSCKNNIDIFEPRSKRCTRPVGVRCTKTDDCGKYTECRMLPGKPWGTCQCKPNYGLWKGRCDN